MTDRTRFEDLLDRHLEDELTASEQPEWEALLAAHPDLAREAAEERALVAMMRSAPRERAPDGLLASAIAEAKGPAHSARIESAIPLWRSQFLKIAAAVVLLAGGWIAWDVRQKVDSPAGLDVMAPLGESETFSAKKAEEFRAWLEVEADGTKEAPPEEFSDPSGPGTFADEAGQAHRQEAGADAIGASQPRQDSPPPPATESALAEKAATSAKEAAASEVAERRNQPARSRSVMMAAPTEPTSGEAAAAAEAESSRRQSRAATYQAPPLATQDADALVESLGARRIAETPYFATAMALANGTAPTASLETSEGARYLVLELDGGSAVPPSTVFEAALPSGIRHVVVPVAAHPAASDDDSSSPAGSLAELLGQVRPAGYALTDSREMLRPGALAPERGSDMPTAPTAGWLVLEFSSRADARNAWDRLTRAPLNEADARRVQRAEFFFQVTGRTWLVLDMNR